VIEMEAKETKESATSMKCVRSIVCDTTMKIKNYMSSTL
jgi:hypothetical protein